MFYNPRRGKMAHLHEKVGGCSRASCPFTCLMVDHATAQNEVVKKDTRGITVFTQQFKCIWACNYKKSQWLQSEYLLFSCLSTTVVKKKKFPMEQKLNGHASRWLADFYGWYQNCKRYIDWLRLQSVSHS